MQGRTAGIERKYIYHQDFSAPNCSGRYRVLPCTWAVLMCDGSFRLQGAQQILGALSMWMLGSPAGSPESPLVQRLVTTGAHFWQSWLPAAANSNVSPVSLEN